MPAHNKNYNMSAWRLIYKEGESFLFSGKFSISSYSLEELKSDPEVIWWRNELGPFTVLHHLSYDGKQNLFGNLFNPAQNRHGLFKITTTPLPATILGGPILCDEVKKFIQGEEHCLGPATLDVYWNDIYFGFPDAKVEGLFNVNWDRRNPKEGEASRL